MKHRCDGCGELIKGRTAIKVAMMEQHQTNNIFRAVFQWMAVAVKWYHGNCISKKYYLDKRERTSIIKTNKATNRRATKCC